jgi:hypothetical protein
VTLLSFPRQESVSWLLESLVLAPPPDVVFSLRTVADSRSGHSDRLTNSNWASATSSDFDEEPVLRVLDPSGLVGSRVMGSSEGAVSLKSCKLAATLRPIPVVVGEAMGSCLYSGGGGEVSGGIWDVVQVVKGGEGGCGISPRDDREVGNVRALRPALRAGREREEFEESIAFFCSMM